MSDGPFNPQFSPVPSGQPAPIVDLKPMADALDLYGLWPLGIERMLTKALVSTSVVSPLHLPHYLAAILLGLKLDGDHAPCVMRLRLLIVTTRDPDIGSIEHVLAIARMYADKLLASPGLNTRSWTPLLVGRLDALGEELNKERASTNER